MSLALRTGISGTTTAVCGSAVLLKLEYAIGVKGWVLFDMARKKKKRAGKSVMKIGGRLYPIKIRKYNFPVTVRKVDAENEGTNQ